MRFQIMNSYVLDAFRNSKSLANLQRQRGIKNINLSVESIALANPIKPADNIRSYSINERLLDTCII
jgi:hypothetical protein